MTRYQFPEGFLWGAAASGPQTEGISNKPHRSIWDSWFAEQPERFLSADWAANRLRHLSSVSPGRGVDEADRVQLLPHVDSVVAAD